MGKFKSLVDTRLVASRKVYGIPDDVGVSYCLDKEVDFRKGLETMIIPLVSFVEEGVRIPISKLLTNFLRKFKICRDQCTPNIFRVVSSIGELNRRARAQPYQAWYQLCI